MCQIDTIKFWITLKITLSVYDGTYIKVKVRKFDGVMKTNFSGNEFPKENTLYTCMLI